MEFEWSIEEQGYREQLRTFIHEALPEGWRGYDMTDRVKYKHDAAQFAGAMAEQGWLTQNWPVEYGGQGASAWRQAILGEEMTPIGEPRGSQYMNVNWIGPAIMQFGTDEQKLYHLRRISEGNVFWCQGFSEPDAGTDLASLRTKAAVSAATIS